VNDAIQRILDFVAGALPDNAAATVVFDGQPTACEHFRVPNKITIRFSRYPQKADDIMRQFLRQTSAAASWTAVTSDREILNTARDMGAQVLLAEDFIARGHSANAQEQKSEASAQKYNPSSVDVDYWLKQFGEGGQE
jgi:predicted RNA-binding protein with PIN domain